MDVAINPSTASVLLFFSRDSAIAVLHYLEQSGLLTVSGNENPSQREPGPIHRFFANRSSTATDVRAVLLSMMIGIAIHQALRGRILAPALAALWYAHDLLVGQK
jgi:hypothetical protein